MSCYVDVCLHRGWKMYGRPIKNCHLIADSEEELLEMAIAIGMKPQWIQRPNNKRSPVHFDLMESRRKTAIENGAIALDRKEFVDKMRELRKQKGENRYGTEKI